MAESEPAAMAAAAAPLPPRRGAATAWVLYDLANTIYAASITYLFAPYFTERFADGDWARTALGLCTTLSMVLSGLVVPLLGALCDATGRARRYLVLATLVNVAAMATWALGGPALSLLAALFVANFAYQTALLFYNAMLPSVTTAERTGWLSGVGVGLGYLGNVVVLGALFVLQPPGFDALEPYFLGMALAFLAFGAPCMLLVRDRRPITAPRLDAALRRSVTDLGSTLRELPRHRPLLLFLLGNFLLVDVLNTAIAFFGDYVKSVFAAQCAAGDLTLLGLAFGPDEMVRFLAVLGLLLSALALLFGVVLGMFTDRHPLAVMRGSGLALGLALVGGAVFGGGDTTAFVLSLVVLGALGLAGIWTAGRKLVLLLAPADKTGQYFGLYGITVKVSVLGVSVYGLIADAAGPQAALLAQTAPLAVGLVLLLLVRLPPSRHAAAP